MLIAALFRGFDIPDDAGNAAVHRRAGAVINGNGVGRYLSKLAVLQIDHVFGVAHERGHVGGKEIFADAHAENERRGHFHGADRPRLVGAENAERIGALKPRGGVQHGGLEIAGIVHVEQMHDDFRVGLAPEYEALAFKLVAQRRVVFDNAVVDDGKFAVGGHMRVRVRVGGRAVRRPAGVADAGSAGQQRAVLCFLRKRVDMAGRLDHMQRAVLLHGDAGAVIPAVFQLAQPVQKQRSRRLRAGKSYNSTHKRISSKVNGASPAGYPQGSGG